MVLQAPEQVKLSPPLPWVSQQGKTGFVTGISARKLILDGEAQPGNQEPIRVHLLDGRICEFSGNRHLVDGQGVLTIEKENELALLTDLLHQVRKNQHINICATEDVESSDRFTGFSAIHFVPKALPDLNFSDLNPKTTFLGHEFALPILITGMTGGVEKGATINRRLAEAAQHYNIPMGVGSQRLALENPELAEIFAVKKFCPRVFLIGNLGCTQLLRSNYLELCQKAAAMIEADALAIHVNILQECVQVEGDRDFAGIFERIGNLCQNLGVPVIVKEVGCGIDLETAERLLTLGVSAIDTGGRGGTSWGYIEGLRSSSQETMDLANCFRDWGIPTAYSLSALRQHLPHTPLIATGGIRDGLMVAKAIALGANLAGVGLPLLRAALAGESQVFQAIDSLRRGLLTTMLLTGSDSLTNLSQRVCLGRPLESNYRNYINALNDLQTNASCN